ncbi:MAG: hypothetical protein ACRDNE_01345 [Gaiellaceae bacterium]
MNLLDGEELGEGGFVLENFSERGFGQLASRIERSTAKEVSAATRA